MNSKNKFRYARVSALCAVLAFASLSSAQTTTVTTVPVGVMQIPIAAGPATTAVGFPLNSDSIYTGKILSVSSSTLSFSGTPFVGENLASSASPFYIRIKTRNQQGRALKVAANTDNTLTLDLTDDTPNSVALDISGSAVTTNDIIEVFPADTLASFFGTGNGLQLNPGTSGFNADTVSFWNGVKYESYFFNSNLGYWAKAGYTGNFNNKAMIPNEGVLIKRKTGAPATTITVTGNVPMHRVLIRHAGNSGSKLIISPFPVDLPMSSMLFNALNPLLTGTSLFNADTVSTWNGVKWTAFYKNSTSGKWLQNGDTNTDFATQTIPSGVPVAIFRRNAKVGMANFIGLDRPYPDPTLN
jgi:uncharacterized protein (TIGR02597 family)